MRRLLVLALVLAGCGGAPAPSQTALRKVDDFPLYELTSTAATPSVYAGVKTPGWACTVFFGAGGDPILGRNFDFHDEPALLRDVRQPHTRWSVAYDLRARVAHVVMGQKYGGRALTFAVS